MDQNTCNLVPTVAYLIVWLHSRIIFYIHLDFSFVHFVLSLNQDHHTCVGSGILGMCKCIHACVHRNYEPTVFWVNLHKHMPSNYEPTVFWVNLHTSNPDLSTVVNTMGFVSIVQELRQYMLDVIKKKKRQYMLEKVGPHIFCVLFCMPYT